MEQQQRTLVECIPLDLRDLYFKSNPLSYIHLKICQFASKQVEAPNPNKN